MVHSFIAAVLAAWVGRYIGWAVRAWPGHERFHCDYLKCPLCENGKRIGCYNAGTLQDKLYILISAAVAFASFYFYGSGVKALVSWLFVTSCMIVSIVDYRYYLIPDKISIHGSIWGFVFALICTVYNKMNHGDVFSYNISLYDSILGFVVGFGSLKLLALLSFLILKKEGMGGGDVKLLGAFGAWAGWKTVVITLILASIIGSVGGILGILYNKIRYHKEYVPMTNLIPFGPYLCLAFLTVFYLGQEPFFNLLEAYQSLFV